MKWHFCAVWRQAEKSKILVGRIRIKDDEYNSFCLLNVFVGEAKPLQSTPTKVLWIYRRKFKVGPVYFYELYRFLKCENQI